MTPISSRSIWKTVRFATRRVCAPGSQLTHSYVSACWKDWTKSGSRFSTKLKLIRTKRATRFRSVLRNYSAERVGRIKSRIKAVAAFWTDAVAEFGFGMFADVSLDLLPVAALIANAFARRADRQDASQDPTDIFGVAYHVRSAARFLIMKVTVIPGAILAVLGH